MPRKCASDCPKMEKRRRYEERISKSRRFVQQHSETDDEMVPSTVASVAVQTDLSDFMESSEEILNVIQLGSDAPKTAREDDMSRREILKQDGGGRIYRKDPEPPIVKPPTPPRPRKVKIDTDFAGESTTDDSAAYELALSTVYYSDEDKPITRDESPESPQSPEVQNVTSRRGHEYCANEECSGQARVPFIYWSSSDMSTAPSCPELCEMDLMKLPEPKERCKSTCLTQALEDKRREIAQAEADFYALHGGFKYFDDFCHCSLKCIITQLIRDKFVRKTTISALFFAMGLKLCRELNGWYIPFYIRRYY